MSDKRESPKHEENHHHHDNHHGHGHNHGHHHHHHGGGDGGCHIPCFVGGIDQKILIKTGPAAPWEIKVGDKVLTRDNGYCEVIWTSSRLIDLRQNPVLPVHIGNQWFSPAHRILQSMGQFDRTLELAHLDDNEYFVEAKYFPQDRFWEGDTVHYIHIMTEEHNVVASISVWDDDDTIIWSETFMPGQSVITSMGKEDFDRLNAVYSGGYMEPARTTLTPSESKLLMKRKTK